jgi:hypothetical protein
MSSETIRKIASGEHVHESKANGFKKALKELGVAFSKDDFVDVTQEVLAQRRGRKLVKLNNEFGIAVPAQLLVTIGRAKVADVAELFHELSVLYQMTGGSGLQYYYEDSREPAKVLA